MSVENEYAASERQIASIVTPSDLPLENIYRREQQSGASLLFTQPIVPNSVSTREQSWTWREAVEEARRVASWLQAQGWPRGSRIVILSKNSAWWMMADFAIWMAGYVSVPLFPAAQDHALVSLFGHAAPVACFLGHMDNRLPESPLFERMTWVRMPTAAIGSGPASSIDWAEILRSQQPLEGTPVREATEIATIIYTSGTTGEPKGVMQTFQALALMGKSMEPALELESVPGKTDRMLSYLPLAHVAERAIIECNAIYAPLHIFFTAGPATFVEDLKRARVTLFFSIPRLFLRFQMGVFEKLPEPKLNRLLAIPLVRRVLSRVLLKKLGLGYTRKVASGAAGIPIEVGEWYRKLGINFVEGYGMTETGITHVPLPGRYRAGFVGHASPFAETRVVPTEENGNEVQIRGEMNFAGYFKNPQLTREAFTDDGFFRTGDSGEIDPQGRLRILGRIKEEFKTSKGKYVIPAGIEKMLLLLPHFESVAVFGAGLNAPFCMAVLTSERRERAATAAGRAALEAELAAELRHVNKTLERHEHLGFFVLSHQAWTVANQLLTPTMKVRRQALESRYAAEFAGWERSQAKVIWLEA